MSTVEVEGTTFIVDDGIVCEFGTARKYDPKTGRGYQMTGHEEPVSLLAYEGFGSDLVRAREYADAWCALAQRAYDKAMTGGTDEH